MRFKNKEEKEQEEVWDRLKNGVPERPELEIFSYNNDVSSMYPNLCNEVFLDGKK